MAAPGTESQRHILCFKELSIFCPLWEQGWVCRMVLYWSQVAAVVFARKGGCLSLRISWVAVLFWSKCQGPPVFSKTPAISHFFPSLSPPFLLPTLLPPSCLFPWTMAQGPYTKKWLTFMWNSKSCLPVSDPWDVITYAPCGSSWTSAWARVSGVFLFTLCWKEAAVGKLLPDEFFHWRGSTSKEKIYMCQPLSPVPGSQKEPGEDSLLCLSKQEGWLPSLL